MHTATATLSSQPAVALLPVDGIPALQLAHSVDSADLLQGQKAVSIVHNGNTYRLQATKLGKLILTK